MSTEIDIKKGKETKSIRVVHNQNPERRWNHIKSHYPDFNYGTIYEVYYISKYIHVFSRLHNSKNLNACFTIIYDSEHMLNVLMY